MAKEGGGGRRRRGWGGGKHPGKNKGEGQRTTQAKVMGNTSGVGFDQCVGVA